MGSLNGLLKRCESETGYIEKASKQNLLDKLLNRGTSNYTKYSDDINKLGLRGCQGQPWCATYQFWQEVQEFGLEKALKNWNMTKSTYVGYNCFSTYNKFKAAGKVSMTPKLGALVIFKSSHMGRVTKISGNTFSTNEGNTSPKAYDRNGGMVANKTYSINDSNIKGFCIIDYEEEKPTTTSTPRNYLMKGDKGAEVKTMQENLIYVGYSCGKAGADGDFGSGTDSAVRAFQKANGLTVDGKYGVKSKAKLEELVANKKKASATVSKANPIVKAGQQHAVNFTGVKIGVDGIVGSETNKMKSRVLQHAMNLDYGKTIAEDGVFGVKSKTKLGSHYVKYGERQFMVTALEILLMLHGIDPKGVETPGRYGNGLVNAAKQFFGDDGTKITASEFLRLIQ